MVPNRIIQLPAFRVVGRKTWISGQDTSLFGRFWEQCRAEGLFERFDRLTRGAPGAHTGGVTLGISRVERDPSRRAFDYMIAVESGAAISAGDLEPYEVPAGRWAVFTCRGKVPESIVEAEIFAFTRWLPESEYEHAFAPEMEVYLPGESGPGYTCEFWLPIRAKSMSDPPGGNSQDTVFGDDGVEDG